MRKKRRNAARTERWTAASGARQAIRYKHDLLANFRANPFSLAYTTGHVTSTIRQWQDADLDATRRQKTWLALNELHGLDLDPDTPDLAKVAARQVIDNDHDTLTESELYVVSPGMHAATMAAAATIDATDLLTLPTEDELSSGWPAGPAPHPAGLTGPRR